MKLSPSDVEFVPCPVDIPAGDTRSADYLIVRLGQDGSIQLQGSHREVERFLAECARSGIVLNLDYLSWCG